MLELPIVASLATMPGREESLQKAVASLWPQVDHLVVHLNGFEAEAVQRIACLWQDSVAFLIWPENFGDQEKFDFGGHELWTEDGPCWRLICDDDIIYPPDYAATMVKHAHDMATPVCVHGSVLTRPFKSFYESRRSYHFVRPLAKYEPVDVPGTGTLCYRSNWIRFRKSYFPEKNMADVQAAVALRENGLHPWAVPREANWLQSADPKNEQTIWHASQREDGSELDTSDKQTAFILEHQNLFDAWSL